MQITAIKAKERDIFKMSLNQRISPNLSETSGKQQVQACRQGGFTLIELLVVIAILGILATIGGGNWGAKRGEAQVRSSADQIRNAMTSARLKALGTGRLQYVGIDMVNASVASTIHDASVAQNAYNVATNTWSANTVWKSMAGVEVQEVLATGQLEAVQPSIKVLEFKPSGGAKRKTGTTRSVRVISTDAAVHLVMIIVVSNVTGRVHVKQCTLAVANAGNC